MSTNNLGQNIDGTLITATIRPNSPLDPIASAWSNEIKGGVHCVMGITAGSASTSRNGIIESRREWGMLCYVEDENKTYQLRNNHNPNDIMNDLNWVEFTNSGKTSDEWLDSVLRIENVEPTTKIDGDRYLVGTSPSGTFWGSGMLSGCVVQWNEASSNWDSTIPTDGMSVRVDNEDNAIFRYKGIFSTGIWYKEKENQIRYIFATASSGASYSATSNPYFSLYEQEALYLVKFDKTNTGTNSISLSINGLPYKSVKKTDGLSLSNILPSEIGINYQYLVTYNGSFFELLNMSSSNTGLSVKYKIPQDMSVVIPPYTQYFLYGDLGIDGTLDNYGQLIIANGEIDLTGEFNNYGGTYSNIYFTEIDGLGTMNYVPTWKSPYMLKGGTTSMYDDGSQVIISSPSFSVCGTISLTNGAGITGSVLTSIDNNGTTAWMRPEVKKYSISREFLANDPVEITHNLNTDDIIFQFWDNETGAYPTDVTYYKGLTNSSPNVIYVISTKGIASGRVVIIG